MKLTKAVAFFWLLGVIPFSPFLTIVHAAPGIVYRVDARAPDDIFKNGFRGWGSNDDVLAHVSGKSTQVGSRDSAFIATTEDMGEAIRFLTFFLSHNTNKQYWLYRIYPGENFYSTNISLQHVALNPQSYSNNAVRAATVLYKTFSVQKEWLAKLTIPSATVIDAAGYRWDEQTNSIKPAGTRTHPSTRPAKPAQDKPYVFHPSEIDLYAYIMTDRCNVITDDFCPAGDEPLRGPQAKPSCEGLPVESSNYIPMTCSALSPVALWLLD